MSIWHPSTEGIDHINIYSKSALPLGRALSNFAHFKFKHRDYGVFNSVEGFYYWLLTGKEHDELKKLWGLEAKKLGESFPKKRKVDKSFKEEIQLAIGLKVMQNEYIKDLLMHSTLVFAHYYYFGEIKYCKVIDKYKEHKYMVEACEQIRLFLKESYNVRHKKPKRKVYSQSSIEPEQHSSWSDV
jgi:hypothetical protein